MHDLRAQSHSAAFLARVNKRDAPDYYDVIKNPMDLGLMLKNVKSGKYRTKEAFRKDLDLIWDNCLAYNTEPSHPLRISAELMRKRSHNLLSYIQDSNDVKSTLSEWLAAHTNLSAAETKKLQSKDSSSLVTSGHSASSLPSSDVTEVPSSDSVEQPSSTVLAATLTASQQIPKVEAAVTHKEDVTAVDDKFENSKAIAVASGSELADAAVRDRRQGERDEWVLSTILDDQSQKTTSHPFFEGAEGAMDIQKLVNDLSSGHVAGLAGLDVCGAGPSSSTARTAAKSSAERVTCILPKLPHSSIPSASATASLSTLEPRRRPPRHRDFMNGVGSSADGLQPRPPPRRKATDQLKRNVATMKRMRRLKHKFDLLDYCLEHEEPMPSGLLVDSEDEDEVVNGKADRKPTSIGHEHRGQPLSCDEARATLRERIGLLLGNAGFASAQARPVDVLTGVVEGFLSSIGRTMRMYTDRYGSTMSSEEIILHTLHSTSSVGVKELDKYMHEDVPRLQSRLDELRRKLEASWKERVAVGEERLVREEDARYFGEESEDLMAGNLPSALDDDFFGFKALGLDQEIGMSNLSVPARLMRARIARPRAGLAQVKEEQQDAYSPPKPFIRITEAAIPAQIGLLQTFYRDMLHRRGYRVGSREGGEDGDAGDAGREDRDPSAGAGTHPTAPATSSQQQQQDDADEVEGMLILPEEDQERPSKYKVPPSGKLPVREFWSAAGPARGARPATAAGAGSSSNGAPAKGKGGSGGAGGGGKSSGAGAGAKGASAKAAAATKPPAAAKKKGGKKGGAS